MKKTILFICLATFYMLQAQSISLPFDFESAATFTNFDGGTGTIIANPVSGGINTSPNVGRMVRNGGQVWAGAYLTTTANVDFSTTPIMSMKVYTTAPVGTNVSFKMEGCGGGCFQEIAAFTTVSGAWETLYWDFTGAPTSYDRLVLLFDLGNVGNGTPASTFFFDDIELVTTVPLPFTPGSQYFCPNAVVNLTYPGLGNYNWYSAPTGGTLLQANSASYTTPLLTGDASFYVQDLASSPFPATDVGPSIQGGTAIGNSTTVSTFFTSNLNNGLFHSVDIYLHIPTGPPPGNTCTYRVDIINITQGTSRTLTQGFGSPADFSRHAYVFPTPLPIFLNDQLEMRITSITGHPCYCISSGAGNNGLYLPFPSSTDPQLTFTGHTSNGVPNNLLSGIDYNVSGDFVDPTRVQVNAIAACALPADLFAFTANQRNGEALLSWSTATASGNETFAIRRSVTGDQFETIGRIQGQDQFTGMGPYEFIDPNPALGLNYYQIEIMDINGDRSLSEVEILNFSEASSFQVFPNPAQEYWNLSSHHAHLITAVSIYDVLGKELLVMYPDQELVQIDATQFSKGTYFAKILSGNQIRVLRLNKE